MAVCTRHQELNEVVSFEGVPGTNAPALKQAGGTAAEGPDGQPQACNGDC